MTTEGITFDDRVEALLRDRGEEGASVNELTFELHAGRAQVRAALRRLSRRGTVARLDRDLYAAAASDKEFEGELVYRDSKRGWVVTDRDGERIEINAAGVADAMPGDVVRGRVVARMGRRGRIGAIDQVLEARGRKLTVDVRRHRGAVVGYARGLNEPVLLPDTLRDVRGAIAVEVVGRRDWRRGSGTLPGRALFGVAQVERGASSRNASRDPDIDDRVRTARALLDQLVVSMGVPTEFPDDALAEVSGVSAPTEVVGDDLTALPLVTIDGSDAKDFDDAVFATDAGAGIRLTVAIADVSAYVPVDSALDVEARQRGCSVYLPSRVYPMLPSHLSDDVCSLRPNVLRRCAWVAMTVGPRGGVRDVDAGFGTMRSRARLTYEQVQEVLDGKPHELPEDVFASVRCLERLRKVLHRRRRVRGMLDLDLPEVAIELTDSGDDIAAMTPRPRLDAHRLIEECMLAANEAVAGLLLHHGAPAIFRIHGDPDEAKVDAFRDLAHAIAPDAALGELKTSRDMTRMLQTLEGTARGQLLSQRLLRSLPRAEYGTESRGHFGLGTREYLHFTSPIRRYPDLEVHRVLRALLGGASGASLDERVSGRLLTSASMANVGEDFATRCERAAGRHLSAFAMRNAVGERFEATVVEVARFGVFVRLEAPRVQGLVPVSQLGDDFFEFDERRYELFGVRTGRTIRVGDALPVQCVSVRVSEGHINFVPAPTDEQARRGRISRRSTRKRKR